MRPQQTIPVIDLFAGPGGLSEGFSRYPHPALHFDVRLSIEKDAIACRTLTLRAFVRQFAKGGLPVEYYDYIKGDYRAIDQLSKLTEWAIAEQHVKQWTLGERNPKNPGHVSSEVLHRTVNEAIRGEKLWVLLGGPPCQAYSLIGRARMTGGGAAARNTSTQIAAQQQGRRRARFLRDVRHRLYREYLRVVAVHQPAIFVMENVKGMLTSPIVTERDAEGQPTKSECAFDLICRDLKNPWHALSEDPDMEELRNLQRQYSGTTCNYEIYSLSSAAATTDDSRDFVLRAEEYGVPQQRHRVILLGIRTDVDPDFHPLEPQKAVTVAQMLGRMPRLRSALSSDASTAKRYGRDRASSWCKAVREETMRVVSDLDDLALIKRLRRLITRKSTTWSPGKPFIKCQNSLNGLPGSLREWMHDPQLGGVIQHQSRAHMAPDLARYLFLSSRMAKRPKTGKIKLSNEHWPRGLLPCHSNVRRRRGKTVVDGFLDRFRVQAWHSSATTITSHIHKDGHYFIHPDPRQCRSLTVREAARLQTFPENFFFEGSRTAQYVQVGNAVPPFLALQLADRVADVLSRASSSTRVSYFSAESYTTPTA